MKETFYLVMSLISFIFFTYYSIFEVDLMNTVIAGILSVLFTIDALGYKILKELKKC